MFLVYCESLFFIIASTWADFQGAWNRKQPPLVVAKKLAPLDQSDSGNLNHSQIGDYCGHLLWPAMTTKPDPFPYPIQILHEDIISLPLSGES